MEPTEQKDCGIAILYVEDEQDAREILTETIRLRYPEVRLLIAENGAAGVDLFKQFHPDIVVTDINMPILNGIRMAKKIKSLRPDTEIIALTAHSDSELLLQAIEVGISNYILKPIDIKRFFKVIDKTIATIRSKQEVVRQHDMIRNLNKELAQKTMELEMVNQELESFNYTVAHDLRSPMVSVSGFSQLLLDKFDSNLDDVSKGCLKIIHQEIIRMDSLVSTLLKFSVHSRKHVAKSMTSLCGIAHEIIANLQLQDPGRHVTFSIAEGLNAFGDPDLLRIALDNLLGNAWKYSAMKDDARIEFGMISKEEDLVYFVKDNGAGFDQQEAAKLFTPFHRLQCDADIEGFGIGLATVHRIIQRHGGRIWAEGKKGEGATFYFTL